MSKNLLRAPLIKSAVLLFGFALIIYLTATSHEGSVWSSLGTIFYAVFKAAQLGVGLILALVLCLAILVGIFLGCVAMVSTENASKMYDQLRQLFTEKFEAVKVPMMKSCVSPAGPSLDELRDSLSNDMVGHVESSMQNIQRPIDESLKSLNARVEQVELDDRYSGISDRLQLQEENLIALEETVGKGADEIQKLNEQLQGISKQIQEMGSDSGVAELTEKMSALESNKNEMDSLCSSLASQFVELQGKIDALKTAGQSDTKETVSNKAESETGHRLFSYIENEKEQEKIGQVVAYGLQNEMTYAQIMEQLASQTNKATAKILAEHPSLTKDYIREMKKS